MKRKIEEYLLQWKNTDNSKRKPLLVYGARQVGKTYTLEKFGTENFSNMVYVNLETNLSLAEFFNADIDPHKIIRYLEAALDQPIIPGKTLIFLDEIQACERALTSLKYFCEQAPEYHIVAAGSLLGVAINREHSSFPVGKVNSQTMYPMDFEEYLWARGKTALTREIKDAYVTMEALPEPLHRQAIDLYKEYLVVGGMPGVVNVFLESGSFRNVPTSQNEIMNNYIADMAKYASNSESVKIRACYNSIPTQLAKDNKKFQYKIVQRGGSAALFGPAIEWLNFAGVVLKCQRINRAVEPVEVYVEPSAFKLYMGDVGLLTAKTGIALQTVLGKGDNVFMGAIAENYIAGQLASQGKKLYYWESKSIAEVDFVWQEGRDIVGIEVKSGEHTRSRSFSVFSEAYSPAYNIRFSLRNFGQTGNLKSVPLYAVFCL
jgi:predicted AAA+ superfamily ATPase